MGDKLTSQAQIENDGEVHAATLLPQSDETFMKRLVEIFNPFEALEIVFEQPGAGLMAIAGLATLVFIRTGLWALVQELLFGGGPPQGLGLQ